MDFMFICFATITVLGGMIVAFHKSIVHSAFALVATLFGVAGLYWAMGADFLGGLQVLLYVGGVTVLLLFAVMLTTRDTMRRSVVRYAFWAPLAVGGVAVCLLRAYQGVLTTVNAKGAVLSEPTPTTEAIGNMLIDRTGYLLVFEVVAVLLLLVLIGAVTVARRGQESSS
ncbi:MAG: NADH:ubiquinone oxidoreductase subunit 6 (subunit J) [Pseudohongiellaceae bacterium]|jgi:NADH:ubiquinone oxidoreductase subunit 6 (subunit J)